jgi:hypothetical protein
MIVVHLGNDFGCPVFRELGELFLKIDGLEGHIFLHPFIGKR